MQLVQFSLFVSACVLVYLTACLALAALEPVEVQRWTLVPCPLSQPTAHPTAHPLQNPLFRGTIEAWSLNPPYVLIR